MTSSISSAASLKMLNMVTGLWVTQAIYIAAELRLADLLNEKPQSSDDLANVTQTDASALYRVLRALAGLEIFSEDADGCFHLTPLAEYLRSDVPGSLRAFAMMLGGEEHRRSWGEVLHSVRTGESAFEHAWGKPHFEYFAENPEAARTFNLAMTSRSGPEDEDVTSIYDFAQHEIIVDVGGGHGSLLSAILKKFGEPKCVLFDMPHVVSSAEEELSRNIPADRLSFRGGDFFDTVPSGGDAYILKKVIHNWDDSHARTILSNCRDVIPSHGRVLVIEPVVPSGNTPSFNKLLDVMMLVYTSRGRERTESEHRDLLKSAGLKLNRATHAPSLVSILEAIPD